MDLVVQGGTVLSQEDGAPPARADVLVRGGVIVEVAPRIRTARAVRVLDAEGCVVLPGLVQGHIHLCQTIFRGLAEDRPLLPWLAERIWPLEAAHDRASLRASARLGLAELVRGGVTAVLDMGTVRHHDAVFEAIAESGLRGASGKAMMDAPSCPDALRERTSESLEESARLCEAWDGREDGRIRYAFAPRFVLSCTERLLRSVADLSRARGALVHTHAAENEDERARVRAERGQDDVGYLASLGLAGPDVFLAHGVLLSDDELAAAAESGTHLVHCPSSNLKLGSGVARVAAWRRAGIAPLLGVDGAACNDRLDPFREMRLGALLSALVAGPGSWSAADVLRAATRGGAEALGLPGGVVAPGRAADLAVIDVETLHAGPGGDLASRVVYAAGPEDVRHVVCAGDALLTDGRLTRVRPREVLADARAALGKLQTQLHKAQAGA